jgi:hypothetical protein
VLNGWRKVGAGPGPKLACWAAAVRRLAEVPVAGPTDGAVEVVGKAEHHDRERVSVFVLTAIVLAIDRPIEPIEE